MTYRSALAGSRTHSSGHPLTVALRACRAAAGPPDGCSAALVIGIELPLNPYQQLTRLTSRSWLENQISVTCID